MKRVLISEPNASIYLTFLPYVWGILKTCSEREPELVGQICWLDPIYERASATESLARYDLASIDVLGLSCYTWNFELQCEIAKHLKAANPDCVTVAGGPDPDIKDPDFFRKHDYFDVVVSKDGEETFNALLIAICQGKKDFFEIPGLYIPKGVNREVAFTGAPRLPNDFSLSPYIAHSDYYLKILEQDPSRHYAAVWETTRGCPYSCAFCDWGSNTMSKIRQFDLERVQSEVDWLFAGKIDNIFLADANFGILPRDLVIADSVVSTMSRSTTRKFFYYSPAKNNPDRSLAISQKLAKSGLQYEQSLPLQHMNPDVLSSVDRKNISPKRQLDFAKGLLENNIPVNVQLIIGLPGDSYTEWKATILQLPEWGLHHDHSVYFFHILPNAPAAASAYREKWEIISINRVVRDPSDFKKVKKDAGVAQEIIVGSRNFSTAEWVQMNVLASIFRALHCGGISFHIANFMRRKYQLSYHDFYEFVIEEYIGKKYREGEFFRWLTRVYEDVLECDDAVVDQITLPELDDDTLTLSVAQAVVFRIARDLDGFVGGLSEAIGVRFLEVDKDLLSSVVDYQRNMIVLPDYDLAQGKRFLLAHDWPGYFARSIEVAAGEMVPDPLPVADTDALIEDWVWVTQSYPRSPEWAGCDKPERWRRWAEFAMNHGQKVAVVLHQKVRLTPVLHQFKGNGGAAADRYRHMLRTWVSTPVKSAIRRAGMLATGVTDGGGRLR
jgi:putative methyltransferase